jgi:hypothetical protein
VLFVLVVTELLSIASEKVAEMLPVIDTALWLSVGEIDETVGAVVSVVVVLSSVVVVSLSVVADVVYSSSSLQEIMMRLKRRRESGMSICPTWFPISGLLLYSMQNSCV